MAWATAALMGSACDTATTVCPACASAEPVDRAADARLHLGEGLAAREAEPARVALHRPPLRQLVEPLELGAGPLPEVGLERPWLRRTLRPRALAIGAAVSRVRSRGEAYTADTLRLSVCSAAMRCATVAACCLALLREVQTRRPTGEDLARGGGLAVAHEQDERGRRWGGRSGHDRQSTYRCRPWIRPGPGPSSRSPRRSSRASPARVSWRGGSRSPTEKRAAFRDGRVLGPRRAGLRRSGRVGRDRRPGARPPTAPTAPGGCSPATARATSSTPPLHRTGFANQPTSVARDDGLELTGRVDHRAGAVRTARQQADDRRARHLPAVPRARARHPRRHGVRAPRRVRATRASAASSGVRPRPPFAHGVEVPLADGRWIVGSYHVSQQNTFTGKLTEPMLDAVLTRARALRSRPTGCQPSRARSSPAA